MAEQADAAVTEEILHLLLRMTAATAEMAEQAERADLE